MRRCPYPMPRAVPLRSTTGMALPLRSLKRSPAATASGNTASEPTMLIGVSASDWAPAGCRWACAAKIRISSADTGAANRWSLVMAPSLLRAVKRLCRRGASILAAPLSQAALLKQLAPAVIVGAKIDKRAGRNPGRCKARTRSWMTWPRWRAAPWASPRACAPRSRRGFASRSSACSPRWTWCRARNSTP